MERETTSTQLSIPSITALQLLQTRYTLISDNAAAPSSKMYDPNVLSQDYSRALITIGALFIVFHAPSWIRVWYKSRFERNLPTVSIGAPYVSYTTDF